MTAVRWPVVVGTLAAAGGLVALAGPLDPPAGPVAPTGKTLAEVEPRIAVNATNTPGDGDSLFRIAQPGSYYLTGNVTGVPGRHGIEIAASGVSLDLMGFEVGGVAGSLDGVSATAGSLTNITVRNGSVRGWGGAGVDLGALAAASSAVIDVRATGNAGDGISAGSVSTITGCAASDNTGNGIAAGNVCVVLACTAASNGLSGIVGGASSTISGCSADGNGAASSGLSEGIFAGDGSIISGCASNNNTSAFFGGVGDRGMGFRTGNRCMIRDCTASRNRGHGFRVPGNSRISGCSASENGSGSTVSAGIYVAGSDNQIDGNKTNGSDFGIQVIASGNVLVRNTCSGNGTNWSIAANNVYGPIIDRTAPASPVVSGNSAAGTLGSTDANANFTY